MKTMQSLLARAARGNRAMSRAALALALGATVGAAPALAQQAAPKAAAPAPAAAGAPASSWVKLCEPGYSIEKSKDGKEEKKEHKICITNHERIDATTGIVLVQAAVRNVDDGKDFVLMVMLPLGMALPPGMQIKAYPKDLWDKVLKGEDIDESKITPIKIPYLLCHGAGCTGETPASPEVMESFKTNGGLIVFGVDGRARPVAFPVPLNGFKDALGGAPADTAEYAKQRANLMKQIAENQQKAIEQYQKETKELQQTQGQGKAGAAPAAGGGAAPASPKK